MRLLIDSHTFLWFVSDDSHLSRHALNLTEDENNEILISMASLWQLAIKFSIGKLTIQKSFDTFIDEQIQTNDFHLLNIDLKHIQIVSTLPLYHRDPFDRMLITQSMSESLPIVSADTALDVYGITGLW